MKGIGERGNSPREGSGNLPDLPPPRVPGVPAGRVSLNHVPNCADSLTTLVRSTLQPVPRAF